MDYCYDHFAIYANIGSLCCPSETSMLDVHHTSFFFFLKKMFQSSELVLGKNHDLLSHMPGSLISSGSGNKETKK